MRLCFENVVCCVGVVLGLVMTQETLIVDEWMGGGERMTEEEGSVRT